ncbi:hypothetical protein [Vibrio splendidus]|uniref:hypothetical protein n=1 Tax=Vibrio splendidus TaxID=29497 RepID=UPI003D0A330A
MNTQTIEISNLAKNISRKRRYLSSYQKAEDLFTEHGCINKTITSAHVILDMIDMELSQRFKARMGLLKELPVKMGEIHKAEARVKFIINIANELVKFNETSSEQTNPHLVGRFRTLLFHAIQLRVINQKRAEQFLRESISLNASTYPIYKVSIAANLHGSLFLHSCQESWKSL